MVGDSVLESVRSLGLYQALGEYGVERDQVDIIARRATGKGSDDPTYEAVKALVEELI